MENLLLRFNILTWEAKKPWEIRQAHEHSTLKPAALLNLNMPRYSLTAVRTLSDNNTTSPVAKVVIFSKN